jgi:hypothetical protein
VVSRVGFLVALGVPDLGLQLSQQAAQLVEICLRHAVRGRADHVALERDTNLYQVVEDLHRIVMADRGV